VACNVENGRHCAIVDSLGKFTTSAVLRFSGLYLKAVDDRQSHRQKMNKRAGLRRIMCAMQRGGVDRLAT